MNKFKNVAEAYNSKDVLRAQNKVEPAWISGYLLEKVSWHREKFKGEYLHVLGIMFRTVEDGVSKERGGVEYEEFLRICEDLEEKYDDIALMQFTPKDHLNIYSRKAKKYTGRFSFGDRFYYLEIFRKDEPTIAYVQSLIDSLKEKI